MAKTDFKSVDEYIASQPEAVQGVLKRVRSTIRKAVPGAEEVISYRIPTYKLHGGPVLYFAGWKQHYSLYPVTDHVVAACNDDLVPYQVNKGTIRFPLSQPVPVKSPELTSEIPSDVTLFVLPSGGPMSESWRSLFRWPPESTPRRSSPTTSQPRRSPRSRPPPPTITPSQFRSGSA
jgi:uncharacterized protein YdhG (YjbR/CyaY superfamily)